MLLSSFDYHLPKKLIAQKPANPRDNSRLLVLERQNGKICHSRFNQIRNFLQKGDVLVLNNSKVLPGRLRGVKLSNKGKAEILLLEENQKKPNGKNFNWASQWKIIGKPKLSLDQEIAFSKGLVGRIVQDLGFEKVIEFNKKGETLRRLIFSLGKTPIPPYIHSYLPENKLRQKYQTVYAKKLGSVAAPTAGLHFTRGLMQKLEKQGIVFKYVDLSVGLGTFQPIKTKKVEDHRMASERVKVDELTAQFLNKAKQQGRRIIAVGTTSTRVLEGFCQQGKLKAGEKSVDIFLYPGYKFKFVDGLITNFHLPKSTPLLMASAFAGKNLIFRAYQDAIKKHYRFYSFGDAMLIL